MKNRKDYNYHRRRSQGGDNRVNKDGLSIRQRRTVKHDYRYYWREPHTGALGISMDTPETDAGQWLSYDLRGWVRIGRRDLPIAAPWYTRYGPQNLCTPTQYARACGTLTAATHASKRYYIDRGNTIGMAASESQQEAYEDAGFSPISRDDAFQYGRVEINNPGQIAYRWTMGGPDYTMPIQTFRAVMAGKWDWFHSEVRP